MTTTPAPVTQPTDTALPPRSEPLVRPRTAAAFISMGMLLAWLSGPAGLPWLGLIGLAIAAAPATVEWTFHALDRRANRAEDEAGEL